MSSLQASRTLVKSPPELWAELSDLGSLARHLGEFGEIRITQVDPESRVEWEADRASGTVRLEPSGWGTRVVLTVATPEPAAVPTPAEDPKTIAAAIAAAQAEEEPEEQAAAEEPAAAAADPVEANLHPEPSAEAEEPATEPEPAPKRGFWARLFGRKKPAATPASEPVALEPEPEEPVAEPEPDQPAEQEHAFGTIEWEVPEPPAAEEPEPEPAAAVDPEAVLHGVLDTLGAAHHRPFSRS